VLRSGYPGGEYHIQQVSEHCWAGAVQRAGEKVSSPGEYSGVAYYFRNSAIIYMAFSITNHQHFIHITYNKNNLMIEMDQLCCYKSNVRTPLESRQIDQCLCMFFSFRMSGIR
jgi:hypothetical protein